MPGYLSQPASGRRRILAEVASHSRESELRACGFTRIAGVDEAGRGALAGPVIAAAVILPERALLPPLRDSKQLAPCEREALLAVICQCAVAWATGVASHELVDERNVLHATHLAMSAAVLGLEPPAEIALVDGLPVPGFPLPHRAVVHGDATSVSIAAASIVAKVTRDRLMAELALEYPEYGFERHKGYGTPEHLGALRRHGPCPVHRRSFAPVRGTGQLRIDAES